MASGSTDPILYIGTYTKKLPHVGGKPADGVYVYRMDTATGALRRQSAVGGLENPSFLTVDPARRYAYAVQETSEFEGHTGGGVSSLSIDQNSGDLTFLGSQPTHGAHSCYVSVHASGHYVMTANYSGGNITVLPIDSHGTIAPASDVVDQTGPHPFHDGPHPHAFETAPGGKFVLVPDCGLDRLYVYRLDTSSGKLAPHDPPWATLAPGAGPRHLTWNADGTRIYCINERNSTLTVFDWDAERGVLKELQTLPTLPADFQGSNSCADIHIHPNGRFVYGSNRGHNSIATFAVGADGTLTAVGHTSTEGRTPRNFAIDPSGAWLLAANQDTNNIATFSIDLHSGLPQYTGLSEEVPSPVCIRFA
jgi:6-phosphogluconolactonase